jgi:hypothetical protein
MGPHTHSTSEQLKWIKVKTASLISIYQTVQQEGVLRLLVVLVNILSCVSGLYQNY